jgi:hypothetical protein
MPLVFVLCMRRRAPSSPYLIFLSILCTATIMTLIRKEDSLPKKATQPTLRVVNVKNTSAFHKSVVIAAIEVAPLNIVVLMVADANAQLRYARAIATARNYTGAHGYTLLV